MDRDPPDRLSGRTALITAGARRIGAELVRALHHRGANVVIHYHRAAEQAQALAAELEGERPGSTAIVGADLRSAAACNDVVAEAGRVWQRLDLLVNNASSFYPTPAATIDAEQFDDLVGTNLRAPTFLSQAARPWLAECAGSIVNIADIHGERPRENYSVYCCAKAGLLMLTQALARELAPAIRVNAVAPGSILWPESAAGDDPELRSAVLAATPLQRQGRPADIAEAVLYLAGAEFVTGEVLRVDGGRAV
jgi:pteridine reductase